MARMMNALQLALGSVGSGIQGYAQARAQREEQEARDKERTAAADRQRMMDSITLLNADYLPEGVSMDAPGATPRPAFDTQTVGGRKFTRAMSPRQTQHMDAVEKERAENRSKRLDASLKPVATPPLRYTEGEGGINVFSPKDGTSTFQPYAKGFTPKKPVERSGKAEPSDATKRQLGNQYMASQARNPSLMAALQNTFSNDPEAAADPGLAAYDLMKSKMIPKLGAGKGYEPPKPSKAAAGDKLDQEIRDAVAARKAAKGTTSPTAAPAAARGAEPSDALIDQERYKKDADYRAWVDSQNK
jgi:hypothetical protein